MSKKKSQEERFGEFVSTIGIDAAQKQLDILKGYMGRITKDEPNKKPAARAARVSTTDGGLANASKT